MVSLVAEAGGLWGQVDTPTLAKFNISPMVLHGKKWVENRA